jgi:hypothetical protein
MKEVTLEHLQLIRLEGPPLETFMHFQSGEQKTEKILTIQVTHMYMHIMYNYTFS